MPSGWERDIRIEIEQLTRTGALIKKYIHYCAASALEYEMSRISKQYYTNFDGREEILGAVRVTTHVLGWRPTAWTPFGEQ